MERYAVPEKRPDHVDPAARESEDGLFVVLSLSTFPAVVGGRFGVVALCVGPAEAKPDIRKCLAMGANTTVHIVDEGMIGADLGLTAEVLAAALKGASDFGGVTAPRSSPTAASSVSPHTATPVLGSS